MIQVRLFGDFSLETDHHARSTAFGTEGRRLVAYMFSFPNRVHRRDKLIDMFWTDARVAQGRAAFSTALWKMRRLIADDSRSSVALSSSPRDIRLDLVDPRVVDAHHFRSATVAAFGPNPHLADCAALDRAASLYTAPFLEEFDDDWVLDQRERLHSLHIRALIHLMGWFARQGQFDNGLLCGRRILAADGMRETVQRAVMLLYVLNGQRGEAIRQFERCRTTLRRECDVDPTPETCSLHSLIRSDGLSARLPHLVADMFSPSTEPWLPTSSF